MPLTVDNLVGYLKAEYASAAKYRNAQFIVQILIAVPAALSVVVTSTLWTYVLAIIGAALLVVWWVVNTKYLASRNAAHAARRAALLAGGLTHSFSPNEVLELKSRMKVSEEVAKSYEQADYYATQLPAGPGRLAEMLEESAFYSAPLQRTSANTMLLIMVAFVLIAAGVTLSVIPFVQQETSINVIRFLLAAFVFAMSSDVFGAFLAHRDAAREIDLIRSRLTAADSRGYPMADVLLAMTDYSSAVESAPESVPLAYKLQEKDLNQKWAAYQRDRNAARLANANKVP